MSKRVATLGKFLQRFTAASQKGQASQLHTEQLALIFVCFVFRLEAALSGYSKKLFDTHTSLSSAYSKGIINGYTKQPLKGRHDGK